MKELGSKNEFGVFSIETEDNISVWLYDFLKRDYKTNLRKCLREGNKIYEVLSPNPDKQNFIIVVYSGIHKTCQKFELNKTILSSNFVIFDEKCQRNFDYLTCLPLEFIPETLQIRYSEISYGNKFIVEKTLN